MGSNPPSEQHTVRAESDPGLSKVETPPATDGRSDTAQPQEDKPTPEDV